MKLLKALKRITEREVKRIEVEEKVLDEKRSRIQIALEQSKTACEGLSKGDKLLKGIYWSGWKINAIETSSMAYGQQVANIRFMGIQIDKDHIQPFEYQETITNPQNQLADMQRIVMTIKQKIAKMKEWYPIILTRNPYFINYIESRIK